MEIGMNALKRIMVIATGLASGRAAVGSASAQARTAVPAKASNVVLVHGAWADGSSWLEVIPAAPGRWSERDLCAKPINFAR
jgi:succinate dehydrogenase/fumarate reductase flavoprotein subunit